MQYNEYKRILLVGTGRLASSIAVNLMRERISLYIVSGDPIKDRKFLNANVEDFKRYANIQIDAEQVQYIPSVDKGPLCDLAIGITSEDFLIKADLILRLETVLAPQTPILVNSESFPLDDLQKHAKHPERIIAANWCEPAYTTSFLELITNAITAASITSQLEAVALNCWHKKPYTVNCGYSIKARMMGALAREAFFLVENGYASVADVDRACRNDAGYYLPFSGNCRYMDLMGTNGYGLVMKDLNQELAKLDRPPAFFSQLIDDGYKGMENDSGFYRYADGEAMEWEKRFRKFSFEIQEIINRYPFGYLMAGSSLVNSKIMLDE